MKGVGKCLVVQREASRSSSPDSQCRQKAGSTGTRESGQITPGQDVHKERLELVAGRRLGVSHSLVLTILHDDGLYPYCYSAIRRQGMLTSLQHDPDFVGHILWTDETQFTRECPFSWHDSHHWHKGNPLTRSRGLQARWSINVRCGILGSWLVGPYLLPDTLTGRKYAVFLREILPELSEDIPLAVRRVMWYQHDGAPPHYSGAARRELDHIFPRSSDLNPMDFLLWEFIKKQVYREPVDRVEE
ncbi:hypothetical protein PR048_007531 [Dryococelus australis]|uniref:Transposable element Tc3 transposase n=1 Tax=Dryococelus australis TaxID=614101 RepID=A0ABQ9HUH4_9NEOP|nr:hypothetical protein PR048_007531 [Dryococelus australis]